MKTNLFLENWKLKRFQTNKTLIILETRKCVNECTDFIVGSQIAWILKRKTEFCSVEMLMSVKVFRFYIIYAFNQKSVYRNVLCVQCSMLNAQCLCLNRCFSMLWFYWFFCGFSIFVCYLCAHNSSVGAILACDLFSAWQFLRKQI